MSATGPTNPVSAPVVGPGVQVVAALLRRGDHIVLVQEQRDGQEIWSIPGGGVERGELVTEALIREVQEETGLRLVTVGPLAYLVKHHHRALSLHGRPDLRLHRLGRRHRRTRPGRQSHRRGPAVAGRGQEGPVVLHRHATRDRARAAYLDGATTRVWTYRDDQPVD
jgi:8-oxo-dGTP diphosphatase